MPEWGLQPKDVIEGPPKRQQPILLRQTSFKALNEAIVFAPSEPGFHSARFGEIEQRGIALTAAGRQRYDELLSAARADASLTHNATYQASLATLFVDFPDDIAELHQQKLAFFEYHLTPLAEPDPNVHYNDVEALIEKGWISYQPQTYEDFLPVSAAGIFQSNLGDQQRSAYQANANQRALEAALGTEIIDEMACYAQRQADSLKAVLAALNRGSSFSN
jgi:uncharacterized glyoxalase superfamily metalloenzyme YdcJ